MIKTNADAVMTVTSPEYPPYWMVNIKKNSQLKTIVKNGNKYKRRQDTPKTYQPAGLVYAVKRKTFFELKGVLPYKDTRGYYIKRDEAVNIDHYSQYLLAKELSKKYLK